jgi:hypothetical protein
VLDWPANINVGTDVVVTLEKAITATVQAPATAAEVPQVEVGVTKTATAPAGCTVEPTSGVGQEVVSTTTPTVLEEQFTIHCTEPSTHGPFTFDNEVGEPKDPHISDPNLANNTAQTTGLSLNALAEVDVSVIQEIVSPPAEIDVSGDVAITLRKTIAAAVQAPATTAGIPSVEVGVTKTASAPDGCTVEPTSVVEQKVVPTVGSLVFDETFTIHCAEPSTHGPFVFHNEIGEPKDPHISDPNLADNKAHSEMTVDVIAYSDLKVADQYIENPPASIPVGQDVVITLDKVLHNNGPWGPVDARTVTVVTAPADCSVVPSVHTQSFWDVPVSVNILHHEPFIIHCSEPSDHSFVFEDEVALTSGPHVRDTVPDNDSWTTELTVPVVAQADINITSVGWVDVPPDHILPFGEPMDVTLRRNVHNNGPWTPVDITIDATATAPPNCTVAPKTVPTSLTNVPVSVDQTVDEIWTIQCTEDGLKTFAFDNSVDVATPHVSDPDLSDNSRHRLLSMIDDVSAEQDYDGDGSCDACELAIGTSLTVTDTDGDGVSDGLMDPDGDGPIMAGPDNCPLAANASQTDFDGDEIGDACDTDDVDSDGFLDGVEVHVGTDPLAGCAGDPPRDAWPLDVNMDGAVTVPGDVLNFAGRIGTDSASPSWWQRLDLNVDSAITVPGDVLKFAGNIGRACE